MSKKLDIPATITSALPDQYADWLKQLKTDIARTENLVSSPLTNLSTE